MTLLEILLVLLVAVLLILLGRRTRKSPSSSDTAAEERRPQRPEPSKLDPRLHQLLRFKPEELQRLKRQEHENYLKEIAAINALRAQANEVDGERRGELINQINERLASLPTPLTFGLYFPEHDPKEVARVTALTVPFVSAILSSDASAEDLIKLGIHVRNQAGRIFTAYVPLELISRLQFSTALTYLELARPWRPQLDVAIPQTQIDALHAAAPPGKGQGVIVGLIEEGPLDFYHPAFRRTDNTLGEGGLGSSRVLFLWDQTLAPNAGESGPPTETSLPPLIGFSPGGGTYGTEYDQAAIDTDLQSYPPAYSTVRSDPNGSFHGTLVASCAVGNSRSPNYSYTGAAPEADIVYVQTKNGNNYVLADSTNFLDGFAYVFARAGEAGKACVINLSASDTLGGHDGTTLGEQFLDNLLLQPGRAITCSAGNVNNAGLRTKGTVAQGAATAVVLEVRSSPVAATNDDTIQIWYDAVDQFAVTITVPTSTPTVIPAVPAGTSSVATVAGVITVEVDSVLDHPRNHDNLIEIRITGVSEANPIPAGDWIVTLDGTSVINGAFEAWVDRNNQGAVRWVVRTPGEGTVGAPATAIRAIAVGAHDAAAPPAIWGLSGCGPARDGRVKPDITAPGFEIKGAWRRDMNAAIPGSLEFPPPEIPQLHPASGTSYSAAIVAGAAAVLFECRGNGLTCEDIKQIFIDLAGVPASGVPSNAFGFGFLQMVAGCPGPPPPGVDAWLRDAVADTGIEPYIGTVVWLSPDISVLDAAGNPTTNPVYDSANFWNNLIDVTVRNRGLQTAQDIDVYLYWADPATNIPYPNEWKTGGIYIGAPAFIQPGNRIVVPQLAAGSSTTVRFAWAPPAPGSNISGDDHFCLIVRLEHGADPSNVSAGGWPVIRGSNNIALKNLHVIGTTGNQASSSFMMNGTDDVDALELFCHRLQAEVELMLPTRALPWRELQLLERTHEPRPYYGCRSGVDPAEDVRRVLERNEVMRILAVTGADRAHVKGATTRLVAARGGPKLVLPEVRLERGAKMPARVFVRNPGFENGVGWIHIGQRSGGKLIGGVSLEVREQLPEVVKYDVRRVGATAEVRRRAKEDPRAI